MFLHHFHKTRPRKYLYPAILLVVALIAAGIFVYSGDKDKLKITLAGHNLSVFIANTDAERVRGLAGRGQLDEDEGMLFIFDQIGSQGIWMKNMRFPIDIIWIGEDKVVQGVSPNVSPDSYPITYTSPGDVKYVLEVNAGWAKQRNVGAGAVLEVPN